MSTVGGSLPCKARGSPPPRVTWFSDDGIPVVSLPEVREVLPNGTLLFPPSMGSSVSQTNHVVRYYCQAVNVIGTLVSKDIHVRAVIDHQWQVRVYDQYVLEGNTAVINCEIPSFIKDFVTVTSWVQGAKNYYPGQDEGSRVQMVPSGQLVIQNVTATDHQMAVRCRAVHTLTGETREAANAAHIYVTESRIDVAPTISELKPQTSVRKGSPAALLCPAYGYPPPRIAWLRRATDLDFRNKDGGISVQFSGNAIVGTGTVLYFSSVQESHAGTYTCSANNSVGVAYHQIRLEVTSALSIQMSPASLRIPAGGTAKIECIVTGSPVRSISWLKNGALLPAGGRTPIDENGRVLRVMGVRARDEGIYQCKATGQMDSAVGSVFLSLGDTPPVLLYRFIEQTMQPGPAASLKCIASGRPTPSIRWSLDGFPISNMNRLVRGQYVRIGGDVVSHVNISSVSPLDGGLYACTAFNGVGRVTHSARLNVYGLPVVRPMGNVDAVAGEILILHCPVGGYPIQDIMWTKGGKTLPLNRRQKVFSNGTLVISNVQSTTDGGSYECTASARTSETSSQSVTVTVVAPPRILPFPSNHVLREGSRLTLTCALTEGDLPLKFEWFWNGQPLDSKMTGSVHKIGDFSSYLILLDVQIYHAGNYTCRVSNVAGSVSRSAFINIQVPPKITPFSFRQNATTGIRLQVSCTLEQGDPPVNFRWFKDGKSLQSGSGGSASLVTRTLNVKIFQLDEFSSVLVIPRVTAQHSGNFTCHAANNVHKVEFTAPLAVSVPPRWKVEPTDVSAFVGDTVLLPCEAEGFPPPSSAWRRAKDGNVDIYDDIASSVPGIHHLTNGSLLLPKVSKSFSGKYLCEAANGIGAGLSKVIHVVVQAPPAFEEKFDNLTVGLGSEAVISCHVRGDPPIEMTWFKNGMALQPTKLYRYEARKPPLIRDASETQNFELVLRMVTEEDGGKFMCTASNEFGSDTKEIYLYVLKAPNIPRSLRVLNKGSRFVHLGWQPPSNGHSPITKYTLKFSRQTGAQEMVIEGNASSANVSDLAPAETYYFTVIAHNAMGASQPSEPLQVTLDGEAPSAAPQNVQGVGRTSSSLHISWIAPDITLSHGKILSYRVALKERNSELADYRYETVSDESTSTEIYDLMAYTEYSVKVQAINAHGRGPFSDDIMVYTLEDIPVAAPDDVSCSSMTARSILVTWQEMKDSETRGRLLGYKVSYFSEKEATALVTKTTAANSVALRNLRPFSNYTVRVAAFTSVGEGPYSANVQCTTEEDVPSPPSGVKGATSGPFSVVISWKSPSQRNGRILTYTVTVRTSSGNSKKHTVHFPAHQLELGLEKNQKSIEVSVAASTRIGEGPASPFVRVHQSLTVPAKITSWGTSLAVHQLSDATLPCQSVGDPQPVITWLKNNIPIEELLDSSLKAYPDGSLVIRNAKKEHSGNYTCTAKNIHGSDSIIYSLLIQMPPSPPSIHVQRAERNSLTISWNEGPDGGAPILGVILSFKEHFGGWKEVSISASETSYVLRDLACGRNYQIFATAYNKVGDGRPSEYVNARTAGAPPVVDQRAALPKANSTHISLNFISWRDGGCSITHFGVAYRKREDSTWVIVSEQIDKTRTGLVEIGALRPNSAYIVRVTAHNSAGVSTKDYNVITAPQSEGDSPTPELIFSGFPSFMSDLRVILPLVASLLALISACVTVGLCIKKRPSNSSSDDEGSFDSLQGSNKQKEQCYATIKKMSPVHKTKMATDTDESEDLNSYATIPLRAQTPSFVYQLSKDKTTKEDLPNCELHPENNRYQQRHPMPLPTHNNYCSFAKLITTKQFAQRRPQDTLDSSYLAVESEASSRHPGIDSSVKSESDEYDTFGSDSDVTPVASSRGAYLYKNKRNR